MRQIHIIAEMRLKPGCRAELMPTLKNMERDSRAEPGNIAYSFVADVDDQDHLFVMETWASEQAIAEHNATEHFKSFVKSMEGKRLDNRVTKVVDLF